MWRGAEKTIINIGDSKGVRTRTWYDNTRRQISSGPNWVAGGGGATPRGERW